MRLLRQHLAMEWVPAKLCIKIDNVRLAKKQAAVGAVGPERCRGMTHGEAGEALRRPSARVVTPPRPASRCGAPLHRPLRKQANVAGEATVVGPQQDAPVGMRPAHILLAQLGDDLRRPHLQ